MDIPAFWFLTVMLVTLLLRRVVTVSLVVHHLIFSWKVFFAILPDNFRLTRSLRLSLATGCMDAVTFTSDVCNTFINRFVLKGLPNGYGENFFWRSFRASVEIRGSKPWARGFSWLMVSLTLCFLMCFVIFHWFLNLWLQCLHVNMFIFLYSH